MKEWKRGDLVVLLSEAHKSEPIVFMVELRHEIAVSVSFFDPLISDMKTIKVDKVFLTSYNPTNQ